MTTHRGGLTRRAVPAGRGLVDRAASLKKEPPTRPGTPDPYTPPVAK